LYVMLCGYTPFMEENQEKMFERIKHGDWKFDENDWSHVSKEAKNLITMMLEPNPDARISAARALRSKWINEDATSLSSRDLSQSVIHMRQDKPKLKDLARAFMALGTLKKALDTGSSGMKNAGSNVVPTQGEDGSHQLL
jgi:serine/threonine protein kinase